MEKISELEWGMLWFDGDKSKTLNQKMLEAAAYYRSKYGTWPDLCYVHPSALENGAGKLVSKIRVIGLGTVLRDHFWIGVGRQRECNHSGCDEVVEKERDDNSTRIAENS